MPSTFETRFEEKIMPIDRDAFGVEVTYQRGVNTSATFTCVRNDIIDTFVDDLGKIIRIVSRQYLLPVASLVINAVTVTPVVGDRINEGSQIWEVVPGQQKAAERLESGGYQWLVETQRVS